MVLRVSYIIQACVEAIFSPRNKRWRETFKAAGQTQIISLLNSCIPSDHCFSHICEANFKQNIWPKDAIKWLKTDCVSCFQSATVYNVELPLDCA